MAIYYGNPGFRSPFLGNVALPDVVTVKWSTGQYLVAGNVVAVSDSAIGSPVVQDSNPIPDGYEIDSINAVITRALMNADNPVTYNLGLQFRVISADGAKTAPVSSGDGTYVCDVTIDVPYVESAYSYCIGGGADVGQLVASGSAVFCEITNMTAIGMAGVEIYMKLKRG